MEKHYLILVNGVLAAKHLTQGGALKHLKALKEKGMNAVLAYAVTQEEK